jgi:hypothetical protein
VVAFPAQYRAYAGNALLAYALKVLFRPTVFLILNSGVMTLSLEII